MSGDAPAPGSGFDVRSVGFLERIAGRIAVAAGLLVAWSVPVAWLPWWGWSAPAAGLAAAACAAWLKWRAGGDADGVPAASGRSTRFLAAAAATAAALLLAAAVDRATLTAGEATADPSLLRDAVAYERVSPTPALGGRIAAQQPVEPPVTPELLNRIEARLDADVASLSHADARKLVAALLEADDQPLVARPGAGPLTRPGLRASLALVLAGGLAARVLPRIRPRPRSSASLPDGDTIPEMPD